LGKYSGAREIADVHLEPQTNSAPEQVKKAILDADIVIAGPGDLYTTILPTLLVYDIQKCLKKTKAKTIYIVNIANKPFETPNYKASDFILAIQKHLGIFPFKYTLVNTNTHPIIPKKLKYSYVPVDMNGILAYNTKVVSANLVNEQFPLYHDSSKLAKEIRHLL